MLLSLRSSRPSLLPPHLLTVLAEGFSTRGDVVEEIVDPHGSSVRTGGSLWETLLDGPIHVLALVRNLRRGLFCKDAQIGNHRSRSQRLPAESERANRLQVVEGEELRGGGEGGGGREEGKEENIPWK